MSLRSRLSLDGPWYFSTTEITDTEHCSLSPETCPQVTVPSPWQADPRFRDHTGSAWYQRNVEIPAGWLEPGRAVILGFGAVDYFAEVWLNGVRAGEHEGGYLPFEMDITAQARPGVNTLTVRVDDPLEIFPEIPHGKQSWYGLLSGIWQPVWVESRAESHIRRVRISTYGERVDASVFLTRELEGQLLDMEVVSPAGEIVARTHTRQPHLSVIVEGALSWSPDEPNLYTLRVRLAASRAVSYSPDAEDADIPGAAEVLDEIGETFGFRTIETREGRILLNGRPFYLRGALDQDYYPDLIATPPSQSYIENQFRMAKEMGLNCLRIHIKVADPRYYAAADRVGLLIWTELPNHSLLTEAARRRARETLAGMVERDGNHPCIGIWTIINESWGIDLTVASQRAWLADTYRWLKELDPSRLVVGNSACWGNFHVTTDIADFHIYYAMPDHHHQWQEWTEQYAGRPSWLFAHEYTDQAAWRAFVSDPWHAPERVLAPEASQAGDEPLLVSEFGNWGLPDLSKLVEGNLGREPWWFDTGLEWGEGIVYPRGLAQRFRDYHLDRVFPSLAALTEASQRLQHDALKFEVENIRSHASIQGYVITEFTDLHWESNGLLDMYRNPKLHYPLLKAFNADDLLIPVWERLVYSSGEIVEMDILFSHYSHGHIEGAVLTWEVRIDGSSRDSGQLSVGGCPPYQVSQAGTVRFAAPAVEHPARADLLVTLFRGNDRIASTSQELYIFPAVSPHFEEGKPGTGLSIFSPGFEPLVSRPGYRIVEDLSRADVAVVSTLDDACRTFILRGGRVLLLAEHDEALQTHIPGLGIQPRRGTPWQGDWASSFGWHRFGTIPTGGVVNFAFAGLTPEHLVMDFAPHEFALHVYAGLFVGWLHKPVPTVARRRTGAGEVLVSTFRLSDHLHKNPLAKHLFAEFLQLIT